jgi:hypothetical protein
MSRDSGMFEEIIALNFLVKRFSIFLIQVISYKFTFVTIFRIYILIMIKIFYLKTLL